MKPVAEENAAPRVSVLFVPRLKDVFFEFVSATAIPIPFKNQ
jgi:hypothetical protein